MFAGKAMLVVFVGMAVRGVYEPMVVLKYLEVLVMMAMMVPTVVLLLLDVEVNMKVSLCLLLFRRQDFNASTGRWWRI